MKSTSDKSITKSSARRTNQSSLPANFYFIMLCKSLLVAALGVLAQAGPISRRDAATVLTDLKTIYTDVSTLNTDVTAWTGDLLAALGILTDYNNVKSALDTAITDTVAASTFSTADSASITSEVSNLAVLIVATLNEIIAKVRSLHLS